MDFVSSARLPRLKLRLANAPSTAPLARWPFAIAGIAVMAVYLPSLRNDFVAWDDDRNFLLNQGFRGLGLANLKWMFTTFLGGPYQPLSWLTLALDHAFWGMNPVGYHLTNIILHGMAAGVLACVAAELYRLRSGKTDWVGVDQLVVGRHVSDLQATAFGLLAAGLWAIHPLRAEAVSWVTERREVLCGLLTLLTVYAHLRGVHWLGVAVLGAAAMLSKATAVMIPALLVLIDLYRTGGLATPRLVSRVLSASVRHAALFAVCVAVGVGAILGQSTEGASVEMTRLSLADRAVVLFNGIAFYLSKTVWPVALAPLYELPTRLDGALERFDVSSLRTAAIVGMGLVALAASAGWLWRRRYPAILPLLAAYVCMIAPTGGLIQSGRQYAADRYSYQPGWILALVGAAVLVALLARIRAARLHRSAVAVAVLALGMALVPPTLAQQAVWRNTESLWTQELAVDPHCAVAHYGLGFLYSTRDDSLANLSQAEQHFRAAIDAMPVYADAHAGLGHVLFRTAREMQAIASYQEALRLAPQHGAALNGLAHVYWRVGRRSDALEQLRTLVEADPHAAASHWLLGSALAADDSPEEAARQFEEAVRCDPGCVPVLTDFAWFLSTYPNHRVRNGKRSVELAERAFRLAGRADERLIKVLAAAYAEAGDFTRATDVVTAASRTLPDDRTNPYSGMIASLRGREPIRATPAFR